MTAGTLPTVLLASLVAWVLYRRVRQQFGPQPMKPRRMTVRVVLLTLVALFLVPMALHTPHGMVASLTGLALGLSLAVYALRHTRVEARPTGVVYTPNPWIGLAVTGLFVGRLALRVAPVFAAVHGASPGHPMALPPRSPLTLALYDLLAGYYAVYSVGLIRRGRDLTRVQRQAGEPPPSP